MNNIENEVLQKELIKKLNINRVGEVEKSKVLEIEEVHPITLIDYRRFDIMAKYIYGFFSKNKINSDWGERLYEDHVWVFNRYDEDDNSGKKGINAFLDSFNRTLNSIRENGYDASVSVLPLGKNNVPLDGAHRLTASLLYDKPVTVVKVNDKHINYNYEFFKKKGLLTKWSDAMAYEYCKLKRNTYIVIQTIDTENKINESKFFLGNYGNIFYEKKVVLYNEGSNNLLLQIKKFNNNSNHSNETPVTEKGILPFLKGNTSIIIYVIEPRVDITHIRQELKEYPIYISNSHEETISFAQTFFNKNSIHFLNNAKNGNRTLDNLLAKYKSSLMEVNPEHLCITSSAVLGAYGIYTLSKIQFIHLDEELISKLKSLEDTDSCNNWVSHCMSIDDIIYNPENHFYYNGFKFSSLQVVKRLKKHDKNLDKRLILYINILILKSRDSIDIESHCYWLKKKFNIFRLKIVEKKKRYRSKINKHYYK